ncbi:MAG: sugar ABC transporter ATP-binding protein [Lachnospiraceae bacterium]|nr:sugar ABC transporter ATP-binding protein [Lachnospiraceae bacterium]
MSLTISNISKNFGAVVAISCAEMSIEKGEVRAILGGNGSGKSTMAKIIGGLATKDTGKIELDGKEINFKSPKDAKNNRVIMTSQELSLFPNLTVEENICLCGVPRKAGIFTDRKQILNKSLRILEVMKLTRIAGELVEKLPPNQQYMVELAKALVQEPQILIIDEITSALYREDVVIVAGIIKQLKENGCIILFISHRMSELYSMCDSVTIMRNGQTHGTYQMADKTEDELLSLMVGREIVSYHGEGKHKEKIQEDIFIRADNIPIPSYNTIESLHISKGEIIGVAGLQGHGQSELLKGLYGTERPILLEIAGKKVRIKNTREAVAQGFAFLSGDRERDGVFGERNLHENVAAVLELIKKKKVTNARVLLDSFNIRYDNPAQVITALSGGNQQKVVVGRWLSINPKLLLADDPTKGIDVKARTDLHEQFAALAKQGNAVVMVSSDDDELVSITSMVERSRVIVMYEGRISKVLEGEAINRENISAAAMPIQKELEYKEGGKKYE